MAFDIGPTRAVRPTMNVTPLVDVVLVLLIIFMVLTPLAVKQLSVNVPVKEAAQENQDDSAEPQVVLQVNGQGSALVNGQAVADSDLAVYLRKAFAVRSDRTLFFDADDAVPFERAMQVLDTARGAGLATIAVLTEPLQ